MKLDSSVQSISYGKRIDFHTHILPAMDDGSGSIDMSWQMIQKSISQGVGGIVLTPHFYPTQDYPEHFLKKRNVRLELLKEKCPCEHLLMISGAEVQYFEGITAMRELPQMRMGTSNGLMIEMPMCRWTNRMLSDIAELNSRGDYQVILAHIHRYLQYQNLEALRQLASLGVWMQVNADIFTGFLSSRKALQLLDEGLIHLLGSDCHNMKERPPNLADAYAFIEKKRGDEAVRRIMDNGFRLLSVEPESMDPYWAEMEFIE